MTSKPPASNGGDDAFAEFDAVRQQPTAATKKRKHRLTAHELKRQQRARKAAAASAGVVSRSDSANQTTIKSQPSLFEQVISGAGSAPPIGPRTLGQNRFVAALPSAMRTPSLSNATTLSAAVASVPDFDRNRKRVEASDALLGATTLTGDAYANTMSNVFALRAQSSFGTDTVNDATAERTVELHSGEFLPVDFSLKHVVRVAMQLNTDGSFAQGDLGDDQNENTRESGLGASPAQRVDVRAARKLQGKLSLRCNFSRAADVQRFASNANGLAFGSEGSSGSAACSLKGDTLSWVYPTEPIPASVARTLGKGVWPGDGAHSLFGAGGRRYVDGSEENSTTPELPVKGTARKSLLPIAQAPPGAGPQMLFKRRLGWARSFMSAFHLVLTGRCPVLYYVEESFTVVFLGPGVIGAQDPTHLLPLSPGE
jgi:hypothetical protein